MGKLDNVRRVVKEDYDEKYHDLIDKLAFVLNSFMEQVTGQVNGCLDFENLAQDIVTFKVTVDSCGVPVTTDQIRSSVASPRGILVINVEDIDNPDDFDTIPFIHFTSGTSSQVIKIKRINGLIDSRPYNLTAVIFR